MTKIITANFLLWKSMDLQTNSRTKRPRRKMMTCNCPMCFDKCEYYCPETDSYKKCRRCDGCRIKLNTSDYDWLD